MFRMWSPQPSIAVSPLADFTLSPNTRRTEQVKTGQVNPDRPLVGPSVNTFAGAFVGSPRSRGNETIYLHRSGPVLENGLDRPKNGYGRYGFPSFYSIFISTVGVDEARVFL